MQIVTCSSCKNFIPDQIGNGQGIGQCQSLEAYKDVLKAKDLPLRKYLEALERAEMKLGIIPMKAKEPIRLLYPNVERTCEKFNQIKGN